MNTLKNTLYIITYYIPYYTLYKYLTLCVKKVIYR